MQLNPIDQQLYDLLHAKLGSLSAGEVNALYADIKNRHIERFYKLTPESKRLLET